MKKQHVFVAGICLLFTTIAAGLVLIPTNSLVADGDVAINTKNFPDKVFRDYVTLCDIDGNGYLSEKEISAKTYMYIKSEDLTSIKGIEYFTSLTSLGLKYSKVKTVDLSKNTRLYDLWLSDNQLESLDLKKNISLRELYCERNNLESLDLSANWNLRLLQCRENKIQSLKFCSGNTLYYIDCYCNELTNLDVSMVKGLEMLDCEANNIKTLDLTQNKRLGRCYCNNNKIASLDISNNPELFSLYCHSNRIRKLDVSRCPYLVRAVEKGEKTTGMDKNLDRNSAYCKYVFGAGTDESATLIIPLTTTVSTVPPPDAPANVKVEATSATSLKVSWDAVDDASGYEVLESLSPNGIFQSLGKRNTLSRTRTDRTPGKTYYYKVRAYKKVDGETIFGRCCPLVSFKLTVGIPENVKAVAESTNSIKVSWSKVNGVTGYQVWRSTEKNGSYSSLGYVTETKRSCTSLTAGETYYFKVRAYVEVEGEKIFGDYSAPVCGVTKPSAPTDLKAKVLSSSTVNVSWSKVSGATGYEVFRSTSPDDNYSRLGSVTATNRDCPNLSAGTKYYFKVRAYIDLDGKKTYGDYSAPISATPKLAAPTNVKAKAVSSSVINVSWDKVTEATGYEVYRSTSKDGPYSRLGEVTTTDRDCPNLKAGTTYYFKVRAFVEKNGKKIYSDYSSPVSAVPKD